MLDREGEGREVAARAVVKHPNFGVSLENCRLTSPHVDESVRVLSIGFCNFEVSICHGGVVHDQTS